MNKMKQLIQNYDLFSTRQHHLISKTHKMPYPHYSSKQSRQYTHRSPQSQSHLQYSPIQKIDRKTSLPPIIQFRRINPFDIQSKKNMVLNKFFKTKDQDYMIQKYQSQRNHTQMGLKKSKDKGNNKFNISINLQQSRMKPVDKYFYKLDNIRLAQRLLIAKPSPQLQRASHKKFYQQHNHYKFQISKNYLSPKKNKIKYKIKKRKEWAQ